MTYARSTVALTLDRLTYIYQDDPGRLGEMLEAEKRVVRFGNEGSGVIHLETLIASDSTTLIPELTMATPVTMPQAAMPSEVPAMSVMARRNADVDDLNRRARRYVAAAGELCPRCAMSSRCVAPCHASIVPAAWRRS